MAFNIALSGINAASTDLDVIANNISNSATTGFKRSRAEFADVYATSRLGSSAIATGRGVRTASIRQDFTQGDVNYTDNNLDLSIDGQGMFRVSDGGKAMYSRAGSFGLDREGYIVNAQDQRLTGYGVNDDGAILPITGDLKIDYSDIAPKPTENVGLSLNLDSLSTVLPPFNVADPATYNYSTSTTVYDSLGASQVATTFLRKDTQNSWSAYLFVDGTEVSQPGGDELEFDAAGELISVNGAPELRYTSTSYPPASGASPMAITFDVSGITQFEGPFGVNEVTQDGYTAGRLDDFDIGTDGTIFGRFSNGQAKLMGQITLTNFPNEEGLAQKGNNVWAESYNSGSPATGQPGSASLGLIQAGALESSNVDITQELVSMISAQRSFQANAQVISTGDTLTQTVINIRR